MKQKGMAVAEVAATLGKKATAVDELLRRGLAWLRRGAMSDAGREERLDAVIVEYLRAVEAGQRPNAEEWVARYPSLADDLRAFIEQNARLERMSEGLTAGGDEGAELPTLRYVGDYELLRVIARGGMGVVYRARQKSLARDVAVKMILSGELAGEAERARFRTEAEAAAGLDHPNILPLYEVGEHEGRPYFSMKLAEGGGLERLVPELKDDPRRAAGLMALVARAVHHAHQRGIIHRDLKPANVLLDESGTPYVSDFGLARRGADRGQTQTGQVLGTPSYMAPEQARAEKNLTVAVDVYALGAILYECLAGRPPFKAESMFDTILQVIGTEPAHPRQHNPKADADLSVIALKCLAKEPGRRYESAAALADDLERWLRGEPIVARPVTRLERGLMWARRNPAVAGLSASLGGVVALGVAVALFFAAWLVAAAVAVVLAGATGVSLLLAFWAVQAANRADLNARRAEKLAAEAQEQRLRAEQSARQAQEQRRLAEFQAAEALAQRQVADRERETAQLLSYAGTLRAAQRAWQEKKYDVVQQLLGECPPSARGWEHRYFSSRLQRAYCPLTGHTDSVSSVAWSPDGERVATASWDRTVRVWCLRTGSPVVTFRGHEEGVVGVAWSPDGDAVASAGWDETARVWCPRSGQERVVFRGPSDQTCNAVTWSPDGARLATGWGDGTIMIWCPEGDGQLLELCGHTAAIAALAWSPDGRSLLSGGEDLTARVWSDSGHLVHTLQGHVGTVTGVAWSADGKRIATAGRGTRLEEGEMNELLIVWDAMSGQNLAAFTDRPRSWEGHGRLIDLTRTVTVNWCSDGKLLTRGLGPAPTWAVPDHPLEVRETIWDVQTGQEVLTSQGPSFGTSPDGRFSLAAFRQHDLFLSETRFSERVPLNDSESVSACCPFLRRCAAWENHESPPHSRLTLRDLRTGETTPVGTDGGNWWCYDVDFSPDGARVAVGDRGGVLHVWDIERNQAVLSRPRPVELGDQSFAFYDISWSPDGTRIATAEFGQPLSVWDALSGQLFTSLDGYARHFTEGGVARLEFRNRLAWSPDGRWIAGAGNDGGVNVWSVNDGRLALHLAGDQSVTAVGWSPDGRQLAAATGRVTSVWCTQRAEVVLKLDKAEGCVSQVCWSPDGARIATVADQKLTFWDAKTGCLLINGPDLDQSRMDAIAWDPTGARLALIDWRSVRILSPDSR